MCEVLLAVIGPRWADARDEAGNLRLEDPNDFVRVEIGAALHRDIPVIPILLDGARLPHPRKLPKDLAELPLRNALDVRHVSFHADMDRLIRALRKPQENVRDSELRALTEPPANMEASASAPDGHAACLDVTGPRPQADHGGPAHNGPLPSAAVPVPSQQHSDGVRRAELIGLTLGVGAGVAAWLPMAVIAIGIAVSGSPAGRVQDEHVFVALSLVLMFLGVPAFAGRRYIVRGRGWIVFGFSVCVGLFFVLWSGLMVGLLRSDSPSNMSGAGIVVSGLATVAGIASLLRARIKYRDIQHFETVWRDSR